MGVCSLAGVAFTIDPESVSWPFSAKVTETKTLGGKVVQVFGAVLGDMEVTGWFGHGGWQDQVKFLARMKQIAIDQESRPGDTASGPVRFQYPGRGWDFLVYLKGYSQPGGGRSVSLRNEVLHNLRWTLTLHIAEENIGLKAAAQDRFIQRLSEGLGWVQNYHGYMGDQVQEQLGTKTVVQYATDKLNAAMTTTPELPDVTP